jgi:hypothetical protein
MHSMQFRQYGGTLRSVSAQTGVDKQMSISTIRLGNGLFRSHNHVQGNELRPCPRPAPRFSFRHGASFPRTGRCPNSCDRPGMRSHQEVLTVTRLPIGQNAENLPSNLRGKQSSNRPIRNVHDSGHWQRIRGLETYISGRARSTFRK